jgi:glutaminyl-tRNA synthetase
MRDPILYRVLHSEHHQTGDKWKMYPMYDYAHPLSDAIEGITHSLCTLEFQDHRPFYDWVVEKVHSEAVPRQYESSRLNIDYTITLNVNYVNWLKVVMSMDGMTRMPTVVGMRRRGFTPEGLRDFCKRVGV